MSRPADRRRRPAAALALVAGGVGLTVALAVPALATTPTESWAPEIALAGGDDRGVELTDGAVRPDGPGTGELVLAPRRTLGPVDTVTGVLTADVPRGARVAVEARGLRGDGRWGPWVAVPRAGAASLDAPTGELSVRVLLRRAEDGTPPVLRGLWLTASATRPSTPPQTTTATTTVTTTVPVTLVPTTAPTTTTTAPSTTAPSTTAPTTTAPTTTTPSTTTTTAPPGTTTTAPPGTTTTAPPGTTTTTQRPAVPPTTQRPAVPPTTQRPTVPPTTTGAEPDAEATTEPDTTEPDTTEPDTTTTTTTTTTTPIPPPGLVPDLPPDPPSAPSPRPTTNAGPPGSWWGADLLAWLARAI